MELLTTVFPSSLADALIKIALFMLVQALVYLILTNSSSVFSGNKMMRSLSFRPARTSSIRRMLGVVSDFPFDADDSSRGFNMSPKLQQGSEIRSSSFSKTD